MIKTTMRELRTYKQIETLYEENSTNWLEFLSFWRSIHPQQIAYAAGIYGCNGRLFSTDLGLIAQTGRTQWLYRV